MLVSYYNTEDLNLIYKVFFFFTNIPLKGILQLLLLGQSFGRQDYKSALTSSHFTILRLQLEIL